uniref:ubiquitinyl hydrolase 1 n=1 Tax=Plectus sambesii TaxID=2011161 RepID=A0A914WJU2_9BILA
MPLYTQNVDNALNYGNRAYAGPQTLRLVMEWDVSTQNLYLDEANEPVLDHQSCADLVEEMKAPAATLMQCFKEYTQTETLEEWRCDSCKHKQRRAEKSLKFRSLPNVLVIHLKRFKHQADGETIKLDPTVQFPIDSLDLSVFMYHSGTTPVPHRKANGFYQQNRPTTHQSGRSSSHNGWQGRKRPPSGNANGRQTDQYLPPDGALYVNTEQNQNLYDLFAVVNHKGESINSGHYTAFCRNPVDSQWRHFDDTFVEKVEPKKVISNNAYLLFYERRGASRATTCRNSSESGFSDHWFYRLPARVAHKYLSQAQLNGGVSSATTPRPSRPDTPASTIDDSESTAFSRTEPARNPHSPTHRPFTPTGMKSARSNGDIRKPPVPLPRPSLANANANQPPPSLNAQLVATLIPWPPSNNNRTLLSPQRKEQHIKSCSAIETDL